MSFVRVEQLGPAAWATICRPERGNALGPEVAGELGAWLERYGNAEDISCLVLAAEGKAFCAGADVKASQAMRDRPAERQAFFAGVDRLLDSFGEVAVPVVAAVDGVAHAGGLELVLVCDLVLAGPAARFGDLHLAHGRIPAWGSAARLTAALGHHRGAAALLLPHVFGPEEMHAAGLVAQVSDQGCLEADAQALAEHFASVPRGALLAMKRLVVAQRLAAVGPLLDIGREHFAAFLAGPHMQAPPSGFGHQENGDST